MHFSGLHAAGEWHTYVDHYLDDFITCGAPNTQQCPTVPSKFKYTDGLE